MDTRANYELNPKDKKTYLKPSIIVYGDVRAVTQAITMFHPTTDGGMGANTRT